MAKKVTNRNRNRNTNNKLALMEREPKGDLQVLVFRVAERILDLTEAKYGISGLKKDLIPIIHNEVIQYVPHLKLTESVLSLARKFGGFPNEAI